MIVCYCNYSAGHCTLMCFCVCGLFSTATVSQLKLPHINREVWWQSASAQPHLARQHADDEHKVWGGVTEKQQKVSWTLSNWHPTTHKQTEQQRLTVFLFIWLLLRRKMENLMLAPQHSSRSLPLSRPPPPSFFLHFTLPCLFSFLLLLLHLFFLLPTWQGRTVFSETALHIRQPS